MMNKAYYCVCDKCGQASSLQFVHSATEAVAQFAAQSWELLDEGPTYCETCWLVMNDEAQPLQS